MHPSASSPTPRALFAAFFSASVTGFGGVMPWARRVLVDKRRWLTADEFTDLLGLCQFLPGGNVINLAVAVGARFQGVRGALAALVGLLAAPFAIMLTLGALYTAYGHLPQVEAVFRGVPAAAAGLVLAMGIRMAQAGAASWRGAIFAAAAFAAVALARLPLVPVLAVLVPLSVAVAWRSTR